MKVENPAALRYLLQDELYLLDEDKSNYTFDANPQPVIETPQVIFNYRGEYKKSFLILVNYPQHKFIEDAHLVALESILKRKEFCLDDVAILNMSEHKTTDYGQLAEHFKPKTLLLLGENSIPVGMEKPLFNIRQATAGLNSLFTFSFDEMMTNNENKKAFWEQMKNL